jgi:hypothetical protein
MNIEQLEAATLRLDPNGRARLAERLLESLESLSAQENAASGPKKHSVGPPRLSRGRFQAVRQTKCFVRLQAGSDRCA